MTTTTPSSDLTVEQIRSQTVQTAFERRFEDCTRHRERGLAILDELGAEGPVNWSEVEHKERLAERGRRLRFHDAVAHFLDDSQGDEAGTILLEKIIGANELLGVRFLFDGAQSARSVGRIEVPVAGGIVRGSAFLVSPRHVMTNNHVIESVAEATNATMQFDFYKRRNGDLGPTIEFALRPDQFFFSDAPLDFTIVALAEHGNDGSTASSRGWHRLISESGKAIVGERINVIQHPGGRPQEVAVHQNRLEFVVDAFLHYTSDTEPGSSGSPVFNDAWELVALHHASRRIDGRTVNEGIRVSSILRRLREFFSDEGAGRASAHAGLLLDELSPDHVASSALPSDVASGSLSGGPIVSGSRATWTIPLQVSVDLGGSSGPLISGATGIMGASSDIALSDEDVKAGLEVLATAASRPYYDELVDDEASRIYYAGSGIHDVKDAARYNRLSGLVEETHETTLSYKKARLVHLYPWIDLRPGELLLNGVYTDQQFDPASLIQEEGLAELQRERIIAERLALESSAVNEAFLEELEAMHPFNCEHVVPQSWFDRQRQPKADLHHLFTCEWSCNSTRSNRAYFDFAGLVDHECGRVDDNRFEPRHNKGAVARATFYFLVRYENEIRGTNAEMPRDRVNALLEWHEAEPPDLWERHRNAEIYKVQGNRNPFIDFPEIDFAAKSQLKRGFV